MTIEIRLLEQADDRKAFRSGDADLDSFFQKYAWQNQFRHHIGNTYVAVERRILGFMTVSVSSMEFERLPADLKRKLPRYPLPVLRVARLAISEDAQGQGIGRRLMRAAFAMAIELRAKLGCAGVVVDAKRGAESFYSSFGFEPLEIIEGELQEKPTPRPMFLAIREVESAIKAVTS
ncbi:MAG TPA: GNAT family N-acetyltransferase [Candidatus Acidoferrales bacterium]|nr:GNAT family N-acetyltransferase [Candidatus Acidoferrales bacterium]